jgi:ribonuclease III
VSAESLEALQCRLGTAFADAGLLLRAVTHPSWALEQGGQDYERLEFLGDSVLGFVVAEYLHATFPELAEGELTRMKIALVSGPALAETGRELGLADAARLGRGAAREGIKPSVLEAMFEAIVGAVYLDAGVDVAREFVLRALGSRLDPAALVAGVSDPKSTLQEYTQARGLGLPAYRITGNEGPAHDPRFFAEVEVGERVVGRGDGTSKQSAEQAAAEAALETLD